MKLAKLSICFGVAAGVFMTAAEPQTTTGNSGERFAKLSWSKPAIRMESDILRVGDTMRLFIDRTNISHQPILVGEDLKNTRRAALGYHVEVRGEKGELASETRWGKFVRTGKRGLGEPETVEVGGMSHERYVQPSEAYTEAIELRDLYELSQPGKYTAQIVDVDEKANVVVESNKVTFTITK